MSDEEARHAHAHPPIGGGPECVLCPVCVVLQALSSTKPEVMDHLVAAGRELALALKAFAEQQADGQERARERLRRIDVE